MPGLIFSKQGVDYLFGWAICAPDYTFLKAKTGVYLHPKEHAQLETLRYEKRQHQFLLGRYGVKQACLRLQPALDPCSICVMNGVLGQPLINQTHRLVSLSHAGPWCFALVGPDAHPVAVDLELRSIHNQTAMAACMTPAEQLLIQNNPAWDVLLGYTLFWTAKEALAKVLKTGLTLPWDWLSIQQCHRVQDNSYQGEYTHFCQYAFSSTVCEEYVITVAHPKGSVCDTLSACVTTSMTHNMTRNPEHNQHNTDHNQHAHT